MARIIYDSKLIQPIQTISITKDYSRNGAGDIIGKIFNLQINGTLVAFKGSPNSSGILWDQSGNPPDEILSSDTTKFASILRKQEAIRELFSTDGLSFEIAPLDGSEAMRCNPRIGPITFEEGPWVDTCRYSISLEADELYPSEEDLFTEYISASEESWNIETDEPEDLTKPRTYRLTHTVSAVGKKFFDSVGASRPAWEQAREYVLPRLGFDTTIALSSGVNNLPSFYGGYNHVRSENIDETNGSFAVTETWLLASGTALEDFTVQTRIDISDGKKHVTIDGSVVGLEQRDSNLNLVTSKYDNAVAKFNVVEGLLLNRAQTYSGYNLNGTAVGKTVGRNPIAGSINYSYEYDTRLGFFVSGVISESISMTNSFDNDIFAVIPILGRARGSLIQLLDTKQPVERNISIELVFDSDYIPSGSTFAERINTYNPRFHEPQKTQIQDLVNAMKPAGTMLNNIGELCTDQVVQSQQETWNFNELRWSYQCTFIAE